MCMIMAEGVSLLHINFEIFCQIGTYCPRVFMYRPNQVINNLNVIHVRALINISYNKTNKFTDVIIIFLHTIRHNSDKFRLTLIAFLELLSISEVRIKHVYMFCIDVQ
jgi:hypothetical protein